MIEATVRLHHEDETYDEGKPVTLVLEVAGYLSPYTPAITHLPPDRCRPAEGGTLDITTVKPVGLILAGEWQRVSSGDSTPCNHASCHSIHIGARYRDLTRFDGKWEDLVDNDEAAEVALADRDSEASRAQWG